MDYFKMKPRAWICPYCGEEHEYEGQNLEEYKESSPLELVCKKEEWNFPGKITFYCKGEKFWISIRATCEDLDTYSGEFSKKIISKVIKIEGFALEDITKKEKKTDCSCCTVYSCHCKCSSCCGRAICAYHSNATLETDGRYKYKTRFGFVWEESSMKNTIFDQLYRHTPEENVGLIKEWAEKYKPTLQWAVPVVSIYTAYRLLNSSKVDLTKIGKECEKKLGFAFEPLKDKKALRELMAIGGATAAAYVAIKGLGAIFNTEDEITSESVENGMSKLEKIHQKFAWITPKTEKLLPVAVSVIVFYMMTQKPEVLEGAKEKGKNIAEDLISKALVYLGLVKLFVADKLSIDLSNKEEVQKLKKFAFLAVVAGVGLFLYGTNNSDKQEHIEQKNFVKQLLDIMKKLMPTAFAGVASYLVAKNFMPKEYAEVIQPEADTEVID